ncbi:hypothetical protein J3A83DRAFT_4092870, partial [Scleroderma citrinum]
GMSAMWNVHQLLMDMCSLKKSVIFGLYYHDTLQVVERSGPGLIFYGHGRESVSMTLITCSQRSKPNTHLRPLLLRCILTQRPSNLLRTVNMPRLCESADKYSFLVVIDETVRSFANVDVLPFADIV